MAIARLDRGVLRLSGDNIIPWLQGLITNTLTSDICFAALLTPQGKIIADFFVTRAGEALLIDTPRKFLPTLQKRLRLYKLREKIDIEDLSDSHFVYAFWDGYGEIGDADPRHFDLGRRLISDDLLDADGDYDAHRLALGIPESEYDFESISTFPANANMDLLNGVDYKKGCFIGQEVVSRMHRKTEVRKRMCGFSYSGTATKGDQIKIAEKPVGEVLHINNGQGIALVRADKLTAPPTLNGHSILIREPTVGH